MTAFEVCIGAHVTIEMIDWYSLSICEYCDQETFYLQSWVTNAANNLPLIHEMKCEVVIQFKNIRILKN